MSPKIQDHIGEALINPRQYSAALTELQRRLKSLSRDSGVHRLATQLESVRRRRFQSFTKILFYSSFGRFKSWTVRHQSRFFGGSTLIQITSKLLPILKFGGGEVNWSLQPNFATIVDFDRWYDNIMMSGLAQHVRELSLQPDFAKSRRNNLSGAKSKTNTSSVHLTSSVTCANCDGNHHIESCFKLKNMPAD